LVYGLVGMLVDSMEVEINYWYMAACVGKREHKPSGAQPGPGVCLIWISRLDKQSPNVAFKAVLLGAGGFFVKWNSYPDALSLCFTRQGLGTRAGSIHSLVCKCHHQSVVCIQLKADFVGFTTPYPHTSKLVDAHE